MKRIDAASSGDVQEEAIFAAQIEGVNLILTRVDGQVYAVENKCAHLGLSMARGTMTGATLKCPWHGSTFDVCSGKNLDWVNGFVGVPMPRWTHSLIALGKEPTGLRTFETTEEAGRVFVTI